MSKQIGFDRLFDAQSFDAGTTQLVKYLNRITEEINKAKNSASQFAKIMGAELKKEIAQLSSTSANLAKKMQDITQKMNDFKVATSNTKKVISDYEKENEKLRKELENLKKAQQDVTNTTKNKSQVMGQLRQSLIGVASGATILHNGIQILKEQLTLAVKSTIEFEQAMKEVQAISRASSEQLVALTANANKLGASTEKTAVEIAKLQKELAKLGFTSTEIIASSQAIVDLSTATGEDLAGSATVAAATLRAFGLEAVEMNRVVDVMAGSFVRSGLDLEKFRESMKLVAPIARATGVDIEVTTAALSKLADAGLSGSLAGTALRNLLSSMADPSEKLTKFLGGLNVELADGVKTSDDLVLAFKELKDSGIDLATAVQMVDVRARPAFFTLLNQADAVEALAREYRSLTGEGHRIAEMMRDTLANDVEIMNSAFDALRRNLIEGTIPAMREMTQTTTTLIEGMRLLSQGYFTQGTVLGELISKYVDWLIAVNPLVFTFNRLTEVLGYFGVELGDLLGVIDEASKENSFNEMAKEATASMELFADSVKMVEMNALLEEYKKLNKETDKSAEEVKRLAEIQEELKRVFGMTAIAVDKETKEVFLNTEAIDRTIKSKVEEARVTRESIKARIDEIDAKVMLNDANINLEKSGQGVVKISVSENKLLEENKDLLREKAILVNALTQEYATLVDNGINGWSVLTQAGLEATSATKSWADATEEAAKRAKEAFDAAAKAQRQIIDDQIFEAKITEETEALKVRFKRESQDKLNEIYDEASEQADGYNLLVNYSAQQYKDAVDAEMKAGEEFLKAVEEATKRKKKADEEQIKSEEDKKQEILNSANDTADGLLKISRFVFDNRQQLRQNELDAISAWEDEQVRLAGDNENAKLRIQEQAEARRVEIKRKQARDNKAEAIFQIILDTAKGIMATIGQTGIFGLPASAIIGALGAAQVATVMARPLPQFAKGTNDSPEGFAEVGEKGRELIRDGRTGQWSLTPDKSTVTYLSKHSQVIPNAQTEQILKADPNIMADNYLKNRIIEVKAPQIDYNKIGEAVGKELKNIPINMTNFDERGVTNYVVKRSVRLQRLNKRY